MLLLLAHKFGSGAHVLHGPGPLTLKGTDLQRVALTAHTLNSALNVFGVRSQNRQTRLLSLSVSARPFVRTEQLISHWTDLAKI